MILEEDENMIFKSSKPGKKRKGEGGREREREGEGRERSTGKWEEKSPEYI